MIASDNRRNPGKGVSPRAKKAPGYVEPILKVMPPSEFSKRGRAGLKVYVVSVLGLGPALHYFGT